MAALQLLEIGAHGVGAPGAIAGELGDPVPVRVVRIDQDRGVVGGAAAERSGPWIENAVDRLAAPLRVVLRVALLFLLALVLADEKIPLHPLVFRRRRMK